MASQFKLRGAMKRSGESAECTVNADTENEAVEMASKDGMMVSEVIDVTRPTVPLTELQLLAKIESHLDKIAFWSKFFGVIAVIALIWVALFGGTRH